MTLRARKLPSGFWKGSTGRKTTRRSKTTRAVKSLAPRARKAVAAIAKRVFNGKTESHFVTTAPEDAYSYKAIYGVTLPQGGIPQLFPCLPQVSVGDSSFTRDGNKIQPTRHTTDLRFVFNDAAVLDAPSGVTAISQAGWDLTIHVWYGYAKRYKNVADVVTNEQTLLEEHLQDGQGNLYEWTGLLRDETFDVNKEVLQVKHKTLRMYKNAGQANVGDVVSPSLSTPMSEARRLRLTWKAPKTLTYADEEHILPENYAPFIIVGYCHNDASQASYISNTGVTADLARIPAIKMMKVDKLYYKDA